MEEKWCVNKSLCMESPFDVTPPDATGLAAVSAVTFDVDNYNIFLNTSKCDFPCINPLLVKLFFSFMF